MVGDMVYSQGIPLIYSGWILMLFPKIITSIILLKEKPFIFPSEILDGNVVQPTLHLLQSQKKLHERVEGIFHQIILKKNRKVLSKGRIQSMDGNLIHIAAVVEDNIRSIEEFIRNGTLTVDYDIRIEPLNDISSWMILHLWRSIKQWSNEISDGYWDKELQAMQEPLDLAIREMEAYRNYLAVVLNDAMKLATATNEPDRFSTESNCRKRNHSELCDIY